MNSLTRRRLLNVAGGVAAAALAGCTGGGNEGGSDEPTQLGELAVTNFDADPHTVHVAFLNDDGPVYWRSKPIDAAADGDPQDIVFDNYPAEPEDAVLHVRLDEQARSEWQRFDFAEADASCVGLNVRIGDFVGEQDDELTLWTTGNPRECED